MSDESPSCTVGGDDAALVGMRKKCHPLYAGGRARRTGPDGSKRLPYENFGVAISEQDTRTVTFF